MMIRCPGCGGRNARDAQSCEWCHRSFVRVSRRGLSARWWGALSGAVVVVLLVAVAGLVALNAGRSTDRATAAAPTASPPPLLPFQVVSPAPLPAVTATATPPTPTRPPAIASPAPSPTPAPRFARVTNTNGLGANLRREPATSSAPVAVAAEGASVRLVGPEERGADGRVWRLVEDQRGNQGWVPADFLVETAAR